MKIIIFAGGAGTRLWPVSRKNSPKQFEKLKDDKSTLLMAVERIKNFSFDNIFISTNEKYVDLVKREVPELPVKNIFLEPARRDLAAAMGLTLLRLKSRGISGPVAVLWADHFMKNPDRFRRALMKGEQMVLSDSKKIVFLGEKPRFANHNLGWIHLGEKIKGDVYEFLGWKYRPGLSACHKMFSSGEWMWNPGYFVFDIDFMLSLYKRFMPRMYKSLSDMAGDDKKVQSSYHKLESISFDNAILEKLEPGNAVVLKVDLSWSDPGTLYALKEAMVAHTDENFVKGNAFVFKCKDCFVFNEEEKKIVTGAGLRGMIVVNTKDAVFVCHKDDVPKIKDMLKEMENEGLGNYL